jgi:ketosteroid isomerase-like protein
VDAAAAARRWADVWERGWREADVDSIAALYADDALFLSQPFREHRPPRDFVAWAFGEQASAECRFGEPVAGDGRAAVDWWAVVTDRDGSTETLAGTSLLRFDADGLVVEQRDVWVSEEGRRELPAWAPR